MDFRNVNTLNVRMNFLSGNLLPLAPGALRCSFAWKLFAFLMWLFQVVQILVVFPGLFMVSLENAIVGTTTCIIIIEVFFMAGRLYARRKLVDRLIGKLNEILRVKDETMKNIVKATLRPMDAPLKFYAWSGVSVFVWFCIPFLSAFDRNSFFYEDFRLPAVFSKQPFSTQVFLLGTLFLMISNVHIFLKKCGVDIYIIHLVLLITSQYRYTATKLAAIFRDAVLQSELEKSSSEADRWVDNALRALCQHHNIVVR